MILLCLKSILLWSIHPCTENLEQSTGWVILEKCRCLLRRQCKAVQSSFAVLRIYAESISDSLHRTPLTSTAAAWPADPLAQHERPPWRVKCKGISSTSQTSIIPIASVSQSMLQVHSPADLYTAMPYGGVRAGPERVFLLYWSRGK